MSTLARLKREADTLRSGKRIFVSSAPVSAYKVANNKKQLLSGEDPLVLALPHDDTSSSGLSLSLIDASVGPELKWTLSSINHVLRTASKHGEPTYLFANILDTDPQAFVAITLNKRTPGDELDHLESIISRVSNFHVAESKPMQVPGPDQVVSALGKGLMKLMFGGGSSSKQQKEQQHATTTPEPQQYQQQHRTPEQERADYLASLDRQAGRGAHEVAGVRGTPAAVGTTAAGSGAARGRGGYYDDDYYEGVRGEEVPTAPVLPGDATGKGRTAMGISDRREAEARLSALKAELGGDKVPNAADVHSRPDDIITHQRPGVGTTPAPGEDRYYQSQHPGTYAGTYYPSVPTTDSPYTPGGGQQQQQQQPDWQSHPAGTLSNPFTGGSSREGRSTDSGAPYHGQGAAPVLTSPGVKPYSYEDYQAARGAPAAAPARAADTGSIYGYNDNIAGRDQYRSRGSEREREKVLLKYQEEAQQAKREWEQAQREAEAAAAAAATRRGGERGASNDDWGAGQWDQRGSTGWEPSYPYGRQQEKEKQQKPGTVPGAVRVGPQRQQKPAPDWLDVLGKVFAGGPAYSGYAPDL